MKEKTKAFYKIVFKYWLRVSVTPFVVATLLQTLLIVIYEYKGWDMGNTALHLINLYWMKKYFEERERQRLCQNKVNRKRDIK